MSYWWLLPIAILIVLLWTGWYVFAFTKDRERSRDVASDPERLDVDPHGPTSVPREQQTPEDRLGGLPDDRPNGLPNNRER